MQDSTSFINLMKTVRSFGTEDPGPPPKLFTAYNQVCIYCGSKIKKDSECKGCGYIK